MSNGLWLAKFGRIEERVVDGDTIIHILDNASVVQLNLVSATILKGLRDREGTMVSVADLLNDIKSKFDVHGISEETLTADICRTVDLFIENGVIVP